MGCENSSKYFKILAVVIIVVTVIHIVGFSSTQWAQLHLQMDGVYVKLYSGLWSHCVCTDVYGADICACVGRTLDPEWMKAVQVLGAVGLAGLIVSGIMTLVLTCQRPNKKRQLINTTLVMLSGLCIAIGVTIFGVEMDKVHELFENIDKSLSSLDIDESIGFSFVLSAIAAGLSLFVCAPLCVVAMQSKPPRNSRVPMVFSSLNQMVVSTQGVIQTQGQPYVPGQYLQQGYPQVQHQWGDQGPINVPPTNYKDHQINENVPPPNYMDHQFDGNVPPPSYTDQQINGNAPPPNYTDHQINGNVPPPSYTDHQINGNAPSPNYTDHQFNRNVSPADYKSHQFNGHF